MNQDRLVATAQALVARGKGILAADEGPADVLSRLANFDVAPADELPRVYRELLFTTPDVEQYISGVILFDDTIRQAAADGTPFPELLARKGIIPGVNVDKGPKQLAGCPGEFVTEGLDGLRERLVEYHHLGARFAKWRAVIIIGPGMPTRTCIEANAHALARYAALSQEQGLVPIVEPEVLMEGVHSIEQCQEATEATLRSVFSQLAEHDVLLEGILLKPNMILAGQAATRQASIDEVAERTIQTFRRVIPAAVPGIVFLSGGQGPRQATQHLNAMNALGGHPWQLSFCFGRALQAPVLEAWRGTAANAPSAQQAFYHRARLNSAARYGSYSSEMEAA